MLTEQFSRKFLDTMKSLSVIVFDSLLKWFPSTTTCLYPTTILNQCIISPYIYKRTYFFLEMNCFL